MLSLRESIEPQASRVGLASTRKPPVWQVANSVPVETASRNVVLVRERRAGRVLKQAGHMDILGIAKHNSK